MRYFFVVVDLQIVKKKERKKLIRTPNIFSSKVHILFRRWRAWRLSAVLQLAARTSLLLTDVALLRVSNVFLVDMTVHICSVWTRTDPTERQ